MGKTRHERRGTLILSRTSVLMFAVSRACGSRRCQLIVARFPAENGGFFAVVFAGDIAIVGGSAAAV
jgi:hypothetical protein